MPENELIHLSSVDFEEAMDFMNMVFSMSGGSTDFPALLPKLYRPDENLMHANLAIRRKGRIRAVVGSYPMTFQVGKAILPVRGIGGVSTHPAEQKSGLMRQLMLAALAEMAEEHCALSILGGQRQRYGYYGYEQGGSVLSIRITKSNLRHFLRNRQPRAIQFTRAGSDLTENQDSISLMMAWHDRQPVHACRRKSDYLAILASWNNHAWLAVNDDGELLGYLTANTDGTHVPELIARDPSLQLDLAAAWAMRQPAGSIRFSFPPWQPEAIRILSEIGESVEINPSLNIRIIDWPLVLASFLQVQGDLKHIPEGTLRLGLAEQTPGSGQACGQENVKIFELVWQQGLASCREIHIGPDQQPDLTLDRFTATRLVTGPMPPQYVLPAADLKNPLLAGLLAEWFPLPVCFPEPDHV